MKGARMGRRDANKKRAAEQPEHKENTDGSSTKVQEGGANNNPHQKDVELSLATVLEEILDFSKYTKQFNRY